MAEVRQVGVLLLVTGVGLAIWSFADRESNDRHEVSQKVSEVRLASSNADITIRTDDVDKTIVEEKRKYWLVKHGDAYKVDGETLTLNGDCGWQCRADYVVTVPRGAKVTGDHGSGDLDVRGVSGVDASSRSGDVSLKDIDGDVKLEVTSGDVSIDQMTGRLDLDAISGDLETTGVRGGPVTAKITSGDLSIVLEEPTDVTAEATSGDIDVLVPAGGYHVEASSRSGDLENRLSDTQGAEHTIKATTTSGDVQLSTR